MEPLASVADLEARMGRSLPVDEVGRATSILSGVSANVRSYTGQSFTEDETTARLRVKSGRIRFPQRPVTAVVSVESTAGVPLVFTWDAGDTLMLGSAVTAFDYEPFRTAPTWVDVTYTHGYATTPADVAEVVIAAAARAFGVGSGSEGLASQSIDGYSESRTPAAVAGPLGLLAEERKILDRYRVRGGTVSTASVYL